MAQPKPQVGAIRWDAWVSKREGPGIAVEHALGPRRYQFRAPFFTKIRGDDDITIDGIDPEVMEREIDYAARASLSHWAFVTYPPPSALSFALELYLKSPSRDRLGFCLFTEAGRWKTPGFLDRVIRLTGERGYARVDGRPLLYLGFLEDSHIEKLWGGIANLRAEVDQARRAIEKQAGANPFIAFADFGAERAGKMVDALGLDAITSYATGGDTTGPAPYSELARRAEGFWNAAADTGHAVIPTLMTGWDRRPRIERPMPWETWQQPGVNLDHYYQTATPEEIETHVRQARKWMETHRDAASPGTMLAYAWNEHDEGGWICPTIRGDGSADDGRVEAFRRAMLDQGAAGA